MTPFKITIILTALTFGVESGCAQSTRPAAAESIHRAADKAWTTQPRCAKIELSHPTSIYEDIPAPGVGQSRCQVLALDGPPDREKRVSTANFDERLWFYDWLAWSYDASRDLPSSTVYKTRLVEFRWSRPLQRWI